MPTKHHKLVVNGIENGGKNTNEEDSPSTFKVDFFAKVFERHNQQRLQKENLLHSPKKVEPSCSSPNVIASMVIFSQQASVTLEKLLITSTPSTNVVNDAINEDIMLASPPQ